MATACAPYILYNLQTNKFLFFSELGQLAKTDTPIQENLLTHCTNAESEAVKLIADQFAKTSTSIRKGVLTHRANAENEASKLMSDEKYSINFECRCLKIDRTKLGYKTNAQIIDDFYKYIEDRCIQLDVTYFEIGTVYAVAKRSVKKWLKSESPEFSTSTDFVNFKTLLANNIAKVYARKQLDTIIPTEFRNIEFEIQTFLEDPVAASTLLRRAIKSQHREEEFGKPHFAENKFIQELNFPVTETNQQSHFDALHQIIGPFLKIPKS